MASAGNREPGPGRSSTGARPLSRSGSKIARIVRPQSYKDMTIYDHCISRGATAGFFPSIYGNGSEFVQTPDTVAKRYEMIHEARLIPLSSANGDSRPRSSSPCSEDLTLVERVRRTGHEYSVTVNDPRTCSAPWTATFPLTAGPGYQIFEYACHEGNYAMRNRLSAARAEEAREAAAGK
jgi:hypothetical protein